MSGMPFNLHLAKSINGKEMGLDKLKQGSQLAMLSRIARSVLPIHPERIAHHWHPIHGVVCIAVGGETQGHGIARQCAQ